MRLPGTTAPASIIKASVASLPERLNALKRAAGWGQEDAAIVDGRHLVLVFAVGHGAPAGRAGVPSRLTKYTDREEFAPYRTESLKLATLRHYREQHQNLEGTWDPMEGRCRSASNLEEMCRRHGTCLVPHGAHLVVTNVTYATEDSNLIYCTAGTSLGASRPDQWKFASGIRDIPRFALLLGAELARQRCGTGWYVAETGMERLFADAVRYSGLASVVHVYHGPVVYDDNAGDVLFARMPELARGLAAHFFKRREFREQQEYRFVLSVQGGRPVEDECYLRINPEFRSVFEKS